MTDNPFTARPAEPRADLPPHPALAALRTHRNFYGRVHGKTLRPAQRAYLTQDLPALRLRDVSIDENPERRLLDLDQAFPGQGPVWLEIGFGGGEHMVRMASANPAVRLIGCEPFVNGVAMALGLLRDTPCPNLRPGHWHLPAWPPQLLPASLRRQPRANHCAQASA